MNIERILGIQCDPDRIRRKVVLPKLCFEHFGIFRIRICLCIQHIAENHIFLIRFLIFSVFEFIFASLPLSRLLAIMEIEAGRAR